MSSNIITIMRRNLRNLIRVAPPEFAIQLQLLLNEDIDDPSQYLDLICESIKLKDVQLSTIALMALKEHVESNVVKPSNLQLITDTVTKIEFTSTESDLVEEGYHQAIRLCCSMVKCRLSHELTNGSISEIIIFNSRVVNSKLVKWLRYKAARSLLTITKIIFRRLSDFPDDPDLKPSYQIRIRLEGTSSQSTFKELANQQGNLSTLRIIEERNQPYNLSFVNDFFCYIASLINPIHDSDEMHKSQEDKIFLGLKLLRIVFQESIGDKSCLIRVTRNTVCYYLVTMLKFCRSSPIICDALDVAVDIFIRLRSHLKYQFEAFLERLMDMLATNYDNTLDTTSSIELRTDILNAVLELFKNIEYLPHELYYNFDCDPYSGNVYENLVQISSKNCFQHSLGTHFTPAQLTSFKNLLKNLSHIYEAECLVTSKLQQQQLQQQQQQLHYTTIDMIEPCEDIKKDIPVNSFIDLVSAKKRKRLLWLALEKFNTRAKDGLQFIKENKLLDGDVELVSFLKDNLRVNKKVLGEYLAKEDSRHVRESFIKSLDFRNLRIDEALRVMLEKFRLPGESQLIERILDAFAIHWFEQNKNILPTSDSALSLAYAIIMLNVDQHSKKVKPMTCDQFDRNLMGPQSTRIYDRKLLELIYTNIRDDEIVLPDEQVGLVRQRYLWKCIMVNSERAESQYWLAFSLNDQQTCTDMNKILFEIMWSPTVAALSFIFDKIDAIIYPELSRQIIEQGFIKFAHLCARHGHLDNLVSSLCKFTTDLGPVGPQSGSSLSEKNSLAALALLSIIRLHANCMRDSWSNIVRNIIQWYFSKCIDDILLIDDFALRRKFRLRMREIKKSPSTMNQQSSTFLRSVYTYFAGQSNNNNPAMLLQHNGDAGDSGQLDGRNNNNNINSPSNGANGKAGIPADVDPNDGTTSVAQTVSSQLQPNSPNEPISPNGLKQQSAIQVLIQTIQDAQYCQESLMELITALTTTTIDGDTEQVEDGEVFKLEIFTQVVLNNKQQAAIIWPRIRAYFARQSSLCGRSSWLGERIISAAFRVAIQFKPKSEVFSLLGHLLGALDADIVRGDHTFVALMSLTELHSSQPANLDAKELEASFNQVIFPFLDKCLDGCDPVQQDRVLNRAINLLSKIFLKHHKQLKELTTFALLWFAILDMMEKYIKTHAALKEAAFELVKNMVLVMDNEQCMSEQMKGFTRDKFMFWGIPISSDY